MNRRIILIILSAVAFALLVGFVWFMFFRGGDAAPAQTGQFGSGQDRPGASATTGGKTNIGTGVAGQGGTTGSNVGAGGTTGGATGGTVTSGGVVSVGTVGSVGAVDSLGGGGVGGVPSVPGVDWLGGTNPAGGGGPVTSFVPSTINQVNDGFVGGSPGIVGSFGGSSSGSSGTSLTAALLGAGIAGGISCSAFMAGGIGGVFSTASVAAVQTNVPTKNTKDFLDCMARVIAKVTIQQMTASIVNWINSGFNGQPSFVTNYQQFFTNIADVAAGEFIRGSSLSFLCSPFQTQIRVAIAQSYARRNNAPSCSLTSIVKNLNRFMNGNFSQGGWGGLLSFVGTPTNNPFGAYQYGQNALANAQSTVLGQKQQDYIIGKGFLSSEKQSDCTVTSGPPAGGIKPGQKTTAIEGGQYRTCTVSITTPGSTIAESLNKTLGVSQDSLNLAKSFDEIINALISQLMTKALQNGVSSLSGSQGYASNYLTPEQQQAQADAQTILTDMQSRVTLIQQYGTVWQGAIADVQNAQSKLQTLANCWETASSTPDLAPERAKVAAANASTTLAALYAYDAQIALYNNNITKANEAIALLQQLQSQMLAVTSASDVAAVSAAYNNALASGAIMSPADVTTAQQDRTTLQSALATRNTQTEAELEQCYAFE